MSLTDEAAQRGVGLILLEIMLQPWHWQQK